MADLLIVTRRTQTIISPETDVGVKWIKEKMVAPSSPGHVIFIQNDVVEDFIKDLQRDCITYEEK